MGDHDDGGALFGQAAQPVQDHLPGVQIEGAGGLIGEDDPGLRGHHPGDGDPLTLAAGELMRLEAGAVGQTHGLQGCHRPALPQRAPGQAGGHGDVLGGGQGGDEVVVLEDEAHVAGAELGAFRRRHEGDRRPQEADPSAGGRIQPRQGVQQGGLAGSRGSHHGGEAAGGQVDVDPAQGRHLGVLAPGNVVDAGQSPGRDRWGHPVVGAARGVRPDGVAVRRRPGAGRGSCRRLCGHDCSFSVSASVPVEWDPARSAHPLGITMNRTSPMKTRHRTRRSHSHQRSLPGPGSQDSSRHRRAMRAIA